MLSKYYNSIWIQIIINLSCDDLNSYVSSAQSKFRYYSIKTESEKLSMHQKKEVIDFQQCLYMMINIGRSLWKRFLRWNKCNEDVRIIIQVHVIIFDTPPSLFAITSIIDMNNSVNNDITLRYYKYKHYRYRCFNTPYTNPLPPIMLVLYMAYYQSTNLEPPHQYPTAPPSIAFVTSV